MWLSLVLDLFYSLNTKISPPYRRIGKCPILSSVYRLVQWLYNSLFFFNDYLTCKNVIFKFDKENHFWIIPDLHGHLLLLLFVPVSCSGRWWPFSQFSHSRFCFLSSLSDKTVMKQSRDGLTGVPFHLELTSFTRRDSS